MRLLAPALLTAALAACGPRSEPVQVAVPAPPATPRIAPAPAFAGPVLGPFGVS